MTGFLHCPAIIGGARRNKPNMERGLVVGKGVATQAAITTSEMQDGFIRIVLPKDVGIDT